MNLVLYAVYVIGFLAFIKFLTYGLLIKVLLGIRFKKGDCELRDLSDVPSHLKELFDTYESNLANLGFSFSHCQIIDEPVVTANSKRWNVVYFNSTEKCYASVIISAMPDQNSPVKVEFVTLFSDGRKLVTLNGMAHNIIGEVPHASLLDPYAESIEKQFQAHLAELSKLKQEKTTTVMEPSVYAADEKKTLDDYLTGLEANGFIKKTKDSDYKLRLLPAFQHGYKTLKGMRKLKAMQAKIRKLSQVQKTPSIKVPVEVEVEAFSRMQELQKPRKAGYVGKVAVFLVSLLLFMLAFGMSFSINTVMVLIAAIFIHESGHYLGMRLFKYKDVQVLFLPFIGGATLGSERKATALQRVIVYLLGPAPGIIMGTSCLLLSQAYSVEFLIEFGIFLLILNYINLLPIIPLDGGRIFELILFSRISFLKSAFLILSIVILAAAGLSMNEPVLLIIPLFLFIGLRSQILLNRGLSRLNKKIKAENLDIRDEIIVPAIFNLLKEQPFNKLAFIRKFNTAKYLLNNVMKKAPTFGISLLSLFMYVVVLLLPVFIILGVGIVHWQAGSSSNYVQGVIGYSPSPDAENVFVTGARSPLNTYNYILDKNGNLVVDLGRGTSFFKPDLIWRPGHQQSYVLCEERAKSFLFNRAATAHIPLSLYNIKTREKRKINQPETDTDDCYVVYQKWSEDGNYLLGTKSSEYEDIWRITSAFRQNVITGEIDEIEMAQADSKHTKFPFFLTKNRILFKEDRLDLEKQSFTLMDLDSREEELYELPSGTIQWEMTSGGRMLIALKKLFNENMVSYQIMTKDLETSREKILMESPDLPQFSFEDAARGKPVFVSIELSPLGQWIICTSESIHRKTIKWLINIIHGSHCKLLEHDRNKAYLNIIYSKDETRLCVIYSPLEYSEITDMPKTGWIEVFDISGTESRKIKRLECDERSYDFHFFGNDRILCIKGSDDYSWWQNRSELWEFNIVDGTQQQFAQPKLPK